MSKFKYQQFFIIIHFIMFIVYLFTKETFFYNSYHSQIPFLFYTLLIIYCLMLKFYSKASYSPGYATDEIIDVENVGTNLFFCKYCQIYVPIRASHCKICQKCVIRRDHHCQWTNNCIGRDNHLYFFLFTSLAFISELIPQLDSTTHLIFCYKKIVKNKFFLFTILCYTSFIIATTFACILTYNLSYQNVLSIMNNSTMWERRKRGRITYLKNYPLNESPFNQGFVRNLIEFCTMRKKKMNWKIEQIENSVLYNNSNSLNENDDNLL